MAAEFTDNLIAYLEEKAKEFNPNFSTSEGTAVRDLFVKPFSVIFQPIVDEILRVRANLSLADAATLTDTDLDRLAANFFITRKSGSRSTGIARVFFNEPVDEFVAQNTVFLAANGVRFVASEDVTITSSGLRLNTFGDLFYQDIPVEAEAEGASGNITVNLITDILIGNDKIVDVTNPSAYTGGSDTETNSELLDRLAIAITFRNLINNSGATLILLENFLRLLDVFVVGFADKNKIVDESIGTGNGVLTTFQLSETEDVIPTTFSASLDVIDELVLTGITPAGFKQLDMFPYTDDSLGLRFGASYLAGTPLVAGTDYVGGPNISVPDELLVTAPTSGPLYPTVFSPIDASPVIEVRYGPTFSGGTPLTLATHYTVNLVTGNIFFTPAGVAIILLNQVHVKYNATSSLTGAFALKASGATAIGGAQLHAAYHAGPLDPSFVSCDFFGVVTFTTPPSIGASITATFEYYLMRRDRMSGDNIALGDDTFGTVNNVHIGGKVDYYLKFIGLEATEVRINGIKAQNFLFVQGAGDPAPTVTQQYISGVALPIVPRLSTTGPLDGAVASTIIETVDPGTNLPSGIFLSEGFYVTDELVAAGPVAPGVFQLDHFPVNTGTLQLHAGTIAGPLLADPVDYTVNLVTGQVTLTVAGAIVVNAAIPPDIHALYSTGDYAIQILPNKLNVNLSQRQRLNLIITDSTFVGVDIFFRYHTHTDFVAVQAFIDDPVNRIVTADLLARAPMPVFVDTTINYSRPQGGPDPSAVQAAITDFINSMKLDKCLSVYNLTKAIRDAGVEFVILPITLTALRVNLDFSKVLISSDNKIDVPPNFQFIARKITVNEVTFEECDAI